jgi:hypothetical protein
MSSKLNTENYESVFFKLLENEYNNEETIQLLEEINNDPFYAFEWDCWQKTKIIDQSDELAKEHAAFFANIKEEVDVIATIPTANGRILPLYQIITTIAACLIMSLGLYFNFNQNDAFTERPLSYHPLEKNNKNQLDSNEKIINKESNIALEKNAIVNPKATSGIASNIVPFKENNDSIIIIDKIGSAIPPIFIMKKPIGPINYENTHDVIAIATAARAGYRRKFTVSQSDTISAEKIIALSALEAEHTNFIKLLDNKRITMVRVDGKLYVRLIEENQKTILVSLK